MTTTPRRNLTAKELILVFGVIAVGFVAQDPANSLGVVIVFLQAVVLIAIGKTLAGIVERRLDGS